MSAAHREHERWRDDLAAYVLGALEPAERAEFERHLEGCENCQAGLRWLMPAINALPESAEQVKPAPSLRTKVLAEAKRDAAQRARAESGGWRRRLAAALRGPGSRPLRPLAGLAAAVLVVAAIGGYAIGGGLGGSDGGGATVESGEAPGVVARVIREGDGGTLRLANVSPLHDDHVLEAWVQRDGEVVPVRALFVPDDRGNASTALPDMAGVEAVMVTVEPAGGSEAPTSTPIATIPLAS